MSKIAVITGYGPGLGSALKKRFEQEDYHVVPVSRSSAVTADLTDSASAHNAFEQINEQYGCPDIVIHNVAELIRGEFLSLSDSDFEQAWRSTVLSAVNVCQAVLPEMLNRQTGTIILTGATASTRGGARFAPFSSAKFALRGLAQSLAREFQKQGIHIVHPVLDGIIWSELSQQRFPGLKQKSCLEPEDIADIYYHLHTQKSSAWTHELDIRPRSENF